MNGEKAVHPFFNKAKQPQDSNESASGDEVVAASSDEQLDGDYGKPAKEKENGRTRKPRVSPQVPSKKQKTLQELVNPKANGLQDRSESEARNAPNGTSSDNALDTPHRKRRRTSQTESVEVGGHDGALVHTPEPLANDTPRRRSSPRVVIPVSSPLPIQAVEPPAKQAKTPPKKMLRLNASGKFSSPISNKTQEEMPPPEAAKKRGRPRKSREALQEKHLLVVMKYNPTANIGEKIDRILSNNERFVTEVATLTSKKQRTPRKSKPLKPTHPFFLGMPKDEQPPPKHESPRKASAVTPGKLRRQTMTERSPMNQPARPAQDYVVGTGLLKDRMMFKHPGAKEPAWPDREQAHVRGLDEHETLNGEQFRKAEAYNRRKRKTAKVPFPAEDSVLNRMSTVLKPEEEGQLRADGFREPHPSLVLPKKLLIPGDEIAHRVALELSVPLRLEKEDGIQHPTPSQSTAHPAVQKLYDTIPNSLSAFDECRGEMSSWLQKYEPSSAATVLQPAREMDVLKDWMTSLTVTSVNNAPKAEPKILHKTEPKPKKKRRRKNDEMDDFLVSSDEEEVAMDELGGLNDVALPTFPGQKITRSVVQTATDGVKLSNAILLSGPHGCGKTAAAYAVAKELGFKVFEISPCERRSGKDVMDKVGDMTENHLVRHHGLDPGEMSAPEEPSLIEEAFQRDLASGRQGKMNAFFKPKADAKEAPLKKKIVQKKVLETVQKAIKKPPKDQQQSLILLEEVDILFKDDKDFWNTIFKLVASSKRPFIMTCNNEQLVPLQAMKLHAILRLEPPPTDLAADYMLVMAAAEGHLLKREAVTSLFHSKDRDLRASIAELNLRCQTGVGDPRGGLSWIYQRYPPGSDLDDKGRKLRVVSEGTYQNGMAFVPDHDLDDDERLLWARHEFGIDPTELFDRDAVSQGYSHSLEHYEWFVDALSAADVYAGRLDTSSLDTTQPPMTVKARSQYIEGLHLLETDEYIEYSSLTLKIAIASTLAAHHAANLLQANDVQSKLLNTIRTTQQNSDSNPKLTRHAFACFDAISIPIESALNAGSGLQQSAFDGPLSPITTDIAPYVRSIIQHERALAEQRELLSRLTSDGRHAKRARTTRAAMSALEGGQRATTRRERWFTKELDVGAVLSTGGKDWPRAESGMVLMDRGSREGTETPASSAEVVGAD